MISAGTIAIGINIGKKNHAGEHKMSKTTGTAEVISYCFSFNELAITRSRLESLMGYASGAMPEPFPPIIDKILSLAADYCDIQAGFIIKDNLNFNKNAHLLSVDKVAFNLREIVYNQLKRAEKIAVFVCTAGPGISDWSKKLMAEGDLATGYIVDVVGSEVVETAMDRAQMMLSEQMTASGFKISNRYSPGYCSWDVSEQHKLFSLLPENFCGIQLSGSALMSPIKSVSGMIGIGENVRYHSYTCNICNSKNCPYRNRKPQRVMTWKTAHEPSGADALAQF